MSAFPICTKQYISAQYIDHILRANHARLYSHLQFLFIYRGRFAIVQNGLTF